MSLSEREIKHNVCMYIIQTKMESNKFLLTLTLWQLLFLGHLVSLLELVEVYPDVDRGIVSTSKFHGKCEH